MRFLRKSNSEKTIIIISDLHLGAGHFYNGKRNVLEDFYHDEELIDFLTYYSTGEYSSKPVELVINGDFLDFLAVPFVPFFDDEFWSEEASYEKLERILEAHPEVMKALISFVEKKNKKIIYIIGNHDAEMILPKVMERFTEVFPVDLRNKVRIMNSNDSHNPHPKITIRHGHQYEFAHQFDLEKSMITSVKGRRYFLPPWGSYFVTRVINKFKEERSYINEVKPIKNFIIHGMIFDTLFTTRFIFAVCYYFIMVHYIRFMKEYKKFDLMRFIEEGRRELALFHDLEELCKEFFKSNPDQKVLIVGHTHDPSMREFADGNIYINTGTWTKMINLDFRKKRNGHILTYAQIDIKKGKQEEKDFSVDLLCWRGKTDYPYDSFH